MRHSYVRVGGVQKKWNDAGDGKKLIKVEDGDKNLEWEKKKFS